MDRIRGHFASGEGEQAVLLDAAASATADEGLSYMAGDWAPSLRKQRMVPLPTRFSPGYGDLSLALQPAILSLLDGASLGVSATVDHMLIPEKSVFAIQGVKPL